MPKADELLSFELICLGDAKAETNAISGLENEGDPEVPFGD